MTSTEKFHHRGRPIQSSRIHSHINMMNECWAESVSFISSTFQLFLILHLLQSWLTLELHGNSILSKPHIILGLPRLCNHNHHIWWNKLDIVFWPNSYMLSFVSAESPSDLYPLEIPVHCNHLSEVFSKSKANALPPQHLYDYAIEVVDGSVSSGSRLDPLFPVECKTTLDCIK